MFKYKVLTVLFVCLIFLSCKKNGMGGKAQVSGYVIYNGVKISNTVIYIKYGATSSAGTDPTQYDSQHTTDALGNFTFASLYPGDYFLYAIGEYNDPHYGFQKVTGSVQVNIPHTKSSVNYNITLSK